MAVCITGFFSWVGVPFRTEWVGKPDVVSLRKKWPFLTTLLSRPGDISFQQSFQGNFMPAVPSDYETLQILRSLWPDDLQSLAKVRRFSDCFSAAFGPRLLANQLYNNNKIDELETFASDWWSCQTYPPSASLGNGQAWGELLSCGGDMLTKLPGKRFSNVERKEASHVKFDNVTFWMEDVQGGPSGRGTLFVDIKLKVPTQ